MANTLQVKRGTKATLPTLAAGEPGWCTDTYELYIGDGAVNRPIPIILPATLPADLTAQGIVTIKTAGENLAFGDTVYFKSDGKAWKADANVAGAYPCRGMAIATINADSAGNILLYGVARNDAWNWTIGGTLYLAIDAGTMTQTQPSATDDCIQVLGVCHPNADTILFNPSQDYITRT